MSARVNEPRTLQAEPVRVLVAVVLADHDPQRLARDVVRHRTGELCCYLRQLMARFPDDPVGEEFWLRDLAYRVLDVNVPVEAPVWQAFAYERRLARVVRGYLVLAESKGLL